MQYIVQEKLFCADHIERKREQGKKIDLFKLNYKIFISYKII